MAYVHVVDPRIAGNADVEPDSQSESNDFIRKIWSPNTVLSAGGYRNAEEVLKAAEKTGDVIALGRYFIPNVGVFQIFFILLCEER